MSLTPIETVTAFFQRWSAGIDALYGSLHECFTPRTVWENVGLSRTVGPVEAEACLRLFEPMKTALRMDVEMLAIAAHGNRVLTERIDHVIGPGGRETVTVRVMGTLEVENGRIVAWRDYFDTLPFAGQSATPPAA
jgi:limonene-1,2-epoxide hydrolase